mgnify:CR=1 FL=1
MDHSREDECSLNGAGFWKAVRRKLSRAVSPEFAQAKLGFGNRMFVDDSAGNKPKHHEPRQAFEQKEHEACEADGLEPLHCVVHETKVRSGRASRQEDPGLGVGHSLARNQHMFGKNLAPQVALTG